MRRSDSSETTECSIGPMPESARRLLGRITLAAKLPGKRRTGNPSAPFEVAGVGDGLTANLHGHEAGNGGYSQGEPMEYRANPRPDRSIGGGLGGPLRNLPQESVARAKPALEAQHSRLGCAISDPALAPRRGSVPLPSAGFAGATIPGGRFREGGEAPLRAERTESTPRVRPSGAALQLDPSHRSSQSVSPRGS